MSCLLWVLGSNYNKNKKVAIVTADGGGIIAMHLFGLQKIIIKNVYKTNIGNIGRIYRIFTLLLGMKPTEHEFKVMGMAGYGSTNTNYYKEPLKVLTDTLNVKGTKFYYKKKLRIIFLF